jgi:peptidyl-prolyl cis-trans isomerase SurA
MKKKYFAIPLIVMSLSANAQTFITYGNNVITKQEFLKAYNKNKTEVADKEKALREYVDLYTNFKLKVKAATELRLDTLAQIQFDVKNFREQIMDNYLSDEKGIERLTIEAFQRMQKDLAVTHYFAPVPAGTVPGDSMKAYKAIMDIYPTLKSGDAKSIQQALAGNTIIKEGDLGFVTAFTVPYQYENIIFGLKTGEASKPYRSSNGWHIFKVTQERPSAGRWRIAQVLISVAPDADDAARAASLQKANEVYAKLVKGENFGEIAKIYSDDRLSYLNGGELPEFGTGTYNTAFENEVHRLKNDNEFSKPFLTPLGYHIIKRIEHTPTPASQEELTFMQDLKQRVMRDARVNAEKQKFTQAIVAKMAPQKLALVKDADLFRYADSLATEPAEARVLAYPISNKKVLRIKNETFSGKDWLDFVAGYKADYAAYKNENNKQLWNKFTEVSAMNYYKQHLEEYNPEFSFQMNEFKEGNMLFEIMERNVWGKAIEDTVGLLKYYNSHKDDFRWGASADILIFNCTTAKVAEDLLDDLKKGKNWRAAAEEMSTAVQADSGRYEISQIVGANSTTPPVKNTYTPIVTNVDGSATFVKYVNVYPANQPRSFEDARGLVINEYQQVLEKEWLAQLKKKYPVSVNEKMIKELL